MNASRPTADELVEIDPAKIDAAREVTEPDPVLFGWTVGWTLVLSGLTIQFLGGAPLESLSGAHAIFSGVAVGGLAASWSLAGTWAFLIDLPSIQEHGPPRQRNAIRLMVVMLLAVNAAILFAFAARNGAFLGQAVMTCALSTLGPVLVWQWTRRAIHRRDSARRQRRTIRQIMGLTAMVAIAIGALKLAKAEIGITIPAMVLSISSAGLWLLLLFAVLGRWWQLGLLTLLVFAAQVIGMLLFVEFETQSEVVVINFTIGFMPGFYLLSTVLLMLSRSSGHRWFGS